VRFTLADFPGFDKLSQRGSSASAVAELVEANPLQK
jgi:hypothetical protein